MDTETINGKAKMLCDANGYTLSLKGFHDFTDFIERNEYHKTVNMFFNLKYDAQAIMSYLDDATLFDLHIFNKATYEDIKIRYIPKKKLTLTFNKKTYKFYDIFQFFYTSLNKASLKYLGETKLDFPIKSINDPQFWIDNYAQIKEYCIQDAKLCGKLGVIAQTQFNEMGLDFNNPVSTASLAEQFAIRYRRVPTFSLKFVHKFGYFSYWGGLFEQYKRGYFEQVSKGDINSAYPYIMNSLPDLAEGEWEFHDKNIEDCNFGFVFVKIRSKKAYVQSLQTMWTSSIKYPVLDWHYRYLTLLEYKFYLDNEICDMNVIDFMLFYPRTDYKPFSYMKSFYDRRRILKEDTDSRELALKILMNSTYGKYIQMIEIIDQDWRIQAGQMFLPIYASYTTSGTRLQILKYLLKHDIDPIAIYTDCIIAEDMPKVNSTSLGGWSEQSKGEMVAIGCGVYSIRDGDKESSHIRGFHESKDRSLFNLIENNREKRIIEMNIVRPLGLGELIRRYKSSSENYLNEWLKFPKHIDINFDKKRVWNDRFKDCNDMLKRNINSQPINLQFR